MRIDGCLVDRDIAWLLRALWRRGYRTDLSCQGGPEQQAYVQFHSLTEGRRFFDYTLDRLITNTPLGAVEIDLFELTLKVVVGLTHEMAGVVSFCADKSAEMTILWTT